MGRRDRLWIGLRWIGLDIFWLVFFFTIRDSGDGGIFLAWAGLSWKIPDFIVPSVVCFTADFCFVIRDSGDGRGLDLQILASHCTVPSVVCFTSDLVC